MKRGRRIDRKIRRDYYSVIKLWEHDIERRSPVFESDNLIHEITQSMTIDENGNKHTKRVNFHIIFS